MKTIGIAMGALVGLGIGLAACSATSDEDNDGNGGSKASGSTTGSAAGGGLVGSSTSGAGGGISTSSGSGGMDGCAEASSQAEATVLPADIIVAVDNSGSMTEEAAEVQAAMNDFVNAIVGSGIDAHVVLISADSTNDEGICVPAPMGSGNCPSDEKLPAYRHVDEVVASSNSLQLILSTYDQWKDSLRPGATKTVAVISDDDSAIDAGTFHNDLVALDPTFTGFKFNAIVSPYDLNPLQCFNCSPPNCAQCDPCCGPQAGFTCVPLPADEGTVYKDLVNQTSGVLGNLCIQDFLPVFQDMATAVVSDSQVACVYAIPEPPDNLDFNFDEVNVEYKPDAQSPAQTLPFVNTPAECGTGGWYYDDPQSPTQILLCPETCTAVQGANAGITVTFGCATVVK